MGYTKLTDKLNIDDLSDGMNVRIILTSDAVGQYLAEQLTGTLLKVSNQGIKLDNVNDGKVIRLNEIEEVVIVDNIY